MVAILNIVRQQNQYVRQKQNEALFESSQVVALIQCCVGKKESQVQQGRIHEDEAWELVHVEQRHCQSTNKLAQHRHENSE